MSRRYALDVDQGNATYLLRLPDGTERFGPLAVTGASRLVLGDVVSGASVGASGAGAILWDDIIIRAGTQAPRVTITAPVHDSTVTGSFTLKGRVVDETTDPLKRLEVLVGSGAWTPVNREHLFSVAVSTTGWVSNEFYWIHVGASDGDRSGTASVRVCYRPGGGSCSGATNGVGDIDFG